MLKLHLNDRPPQSFPLDLHKLDVDADGNLIKRGSNAPLRFHFKAFGADIHGVLTADAQGSDLRLAGEAGSLPYSAQSRWARLHAIKILESANRSLGGFSISRHQRIMVGANMRLTGPATPNALIAALTAFVLEREPFFKLLEMIVREPADRRPKRANKMRR